MKRLLLSLLLLACTVVGQEQLFEIRDFKGLNTVAGDFAIQPNEARIAHNIDFGRNVGSITKRYGYDSISTISGMDSIVAIYGAYYSDGTQQLFVVADINGVGYGAVYVTPKGSVNLDSLSLVWNYWSVFGYPSFTMVNDDIYIVNGYSRGVVYSNGIARSYPPKAPGEPTIVPLNDAGTLDGEYRYVFYVSDTTSAAPSVTIDTTIDTTCYYYSTYRNPEGGFYLLVDVDCSNPDSTAIDTTIDSTAVNSALYQSVVSDKIIVNDGQVLLTDFQFPNTDSLFTSYANGVRLTIARTLANSGRLTPETKIYYVTDFLLPTEDSAKRYVYIDTSSDATLQGLYSSIGVAIDVDRDGRDSTGAISYRYGSPRFVTQDTIGTSTGNSYTYTNSTDTTSAYGIFHGMVDQRDTLGYAYTVTFMDTVTGIESDTGRSLFVWLTTAQRSGAKPYFNTISLPKITTDDSGIVLNLYRSPIKQISYDSSYWELLKSGNFTVSDAINGTAYSTVEQWSRDYLRIKREKDNYYGYKYNLTPDTIVTNEFYLLTQLTVDDTQYTDSLRQDSISTKRLYSKATPPDIMSQIMTYQGRLYGTQNSRLWRSGLLNSLVDTIQSWGQMNFQSLNESDGDIGTVAFPTRTAIRFMKNFSSFNVYEDFSKTEISNTIGCIAPRSYVAGTGGHYYLSKAGVIYETDGQQLERTFNTNLVSQKIKNFDAYDITELADAYGAYFDRKYMLTVEDTTYVFDERSGEWSTWSLPMASATKYGTESNVTFIPGDTLYFTKPGGSTIYRYGTSEYDNYKAGVDSTNIQWFWKSPPLFTNYREVSINSIGLWCNSTTTGDSIGIDIRNEEDVNVGYTWYKTLSQRYYNNGVFSDKGKYLTLKLGTASNAVDIGSTYIDGLDIFFRVVGNTQIE